MKKVFAIAMAALMSLLMVGAAQAANESVTATTNVVPKSGSLYQSNPIPVDFTIRADVNAPDSEIFITPMKNTKITFPAGVSFNPSANQPVCTDAKLNEQSSLGNPAEIVDSCDSSVVGTGTSTIYLAGAKTGPIPDPILVIFNAGKSNAGNAKIKIYGFSKATGVGILMRGELKNGVLDVAIPVLSYDSAVQYYQFDIPGTGLVREDIGVDTEGKDPKYVRAICPASGKLITNADFFLGKRDPATGADSGPETTVSSPQTSQDCSGLPGTARLSAKAKGPAAVKKGAKGAFKVTLKNTGTAIAKAVKVTATGGGKATAGNIAPGASKTVTVKTKVNGRKGGKATVKFTAKGTGVSASTSVKVKVK